MFNPRNHTIYVVRQEMQGGYMPDEISFFARKSEALSYMLDLKHEAQDQEYSVTGSLQDGYYSLMPHDASEYTLGNAIVLGSVNADMYTGNLKDKTFESNEDLAQYLNDHYSA